MEENLSVRDDKIRSLLEKADPLAALWEGRDFHQGQYVMTGAQFGCADLGRRIGFCLQVRLGRGQFGSDMVFLRHPNGRIVTHENQCFWALTKEQQSMAEELFKFKACEEDFSQGYRCTQGVHEVGFLIEDSRSKPVPDEPFAVTIFGAGERG